MYLIKIIIVVLRIIFLYKCGTKNELNNHQLVCLLCHFLEYYRNVQESFWLCSLLASVSMSVTIGCLWSCICATDWIAESVDMTMLFMPRELDLS